MFARLWRNSAFRFGILVLLALLAVAMAAPLMGTVDPAAMDSAHSITLRGTRGEFALLDGSTVAHTFWMGADNFGRDIYSRVLYGTRTSLLVAAFTALVAALGAQLWTVVIAIAIPEVPRVPRLVRALVLTLREEPFVEAARALATPTPTILARHILPNALAPLIVQGTFIAASAVLTEAILSFLGLGLPADVPTWGNIMAEGRVLFSQAPGNVLFPALFLVPTVLAINLLGDGLRDVLDPKFAKR